MEIELKQYIADFNYLIKRINKAEKIPVEILSKYTEKRYMELVQVLNGLIKQASEFQIKIERIINRKLTKYEMLNGINI